jgi:phosphoribosylanthranilate isomerase
LKLDLIFNIGTGFEWENQVVQYADRIKDVLLSSQIEISRIGIVTDNIAKDDLHDVLNDRVKIDKFQTAKELNISWVENVEKNLNYNVWTNISIDENSSNYSVVFDVNSVFGEDTIDMVTALNDAVDIMEGKMKYVI